MVTKNEIKNYLNQANLLLLQKKKLATLHGTYQETVGKPKYSNFTLKYPKINLP